jgi:hypothetical protein
VGDLGVGQGQPEVLRVWDRRTFLSVSAGCGLAWFDSMRPNLVFASRVRSVTGSRDSQSCYLQLIRAKCVLHLLSILLSIL